MKMYRFVALMTLLSSSLVSSFTWAQELGPQFKKIKDGIYVYAGDRKSVV